MPSLVTVPPPIAGDVLARKYRIEEVLGQGGMGIVFAATHELSGKRVAVKWLRPTLLDNERAAQRMIREAQATARIQHPNVVDVYDVGKHKGSVYLVMEHLLGEPLSSCIERGALEPNVAVRVLMPALRGVAAAHRKGVVHRDLKPENIFLCRGDDGEPREAKVLDFGISKLVAPDGDFLASLTKSGTLIGTPCYMSPEQAEDPKQVDQRSDVYALGVILFEALTGRVPFRSSHVSALLVEIAKGTPIVLREVRPELPEAIEAIVSKAIARAPADRYPDVESFARALEPFAPGVTFHTDPTGSHSLPVATRRSAAGDGVAPEPRDRDRPARADVRGDSATVDAAGDHTLPGGNAFGSVSMRVPMYSRLPQFILGIGIVVMLGTLTFYMCRAGAGASKLEGGSRHSRETPHAAR